MSQVFKQALFSKLTSLTGVTGLLGTNGVFYQAVPQTWDHGTNGAALTYVIPENAHGHVLTGSDGTSRASVELHAMGYNTGVLKHVLEQVRLGIDKPPGTWGDGSVQIMSVVQQDDADTDEPPKAGTDQPLFHCQAVYSVQYRVTIPSI